MFELFKKLFSNSFTDEYPKVLIKAAIEHAVDGTDPWIRAASTIKRKLCPARLEIIESNRLRGGRSQRASGPAGTRPQ